MNLNSVPKIQPETESRFEETKPNRTIWSGLVYILVQPELVDSPTTYKMPDD